jgi:hypothetical protein
VIKREFDNDSKEDKQRVPEVRIEHEYTTSLNASSRRVNDIAGEGGSSMNLTPQIISNNPSSSELPDAQIAKSSSQTNLKELLTSGHARKHSNRLSHPNQ